MLVVRDDGNGNGHCRHIERVTPRSLPTRVGRNSDLSSDLAGSVKALSPFGLPDSALRSAQFHPTTWSNRSPRPSSIATFPQIELTSGCASALYRSRRTM
jgi:hypothetical protein